MQQLLAGDFRERNRCGANLRQIAAEVVQQCFFYHQLRPFGYEDDVAQRFALAARAHERAQNIAMRQIIVALVPRRQQKGHAIIGLTIKILGYIGHLHSLRIGKAPVRFNFDIVKIRGHDFGHIISMGVQKFAHAKFAAFVRALCQIQKLGRQLLIAAGLKIT